jgi:hypothetical protein
MRILDRQHERTGGAEPVDEREQAFDLGHDRVASGHPHAESVRGTVLGLAARAQGLQYRRERQTPRQFVAVAPPNRAAQLTAAADPGLQQRALADPGFSLDQHHRAASSRHFLQETGQRGELALPPDEPSRCHRHGNTIGGPGAQHSARASSNANTR